jgi:hypothetical protein
MRDWDRSSGVERRAFLGGATAAGAASVLSPLAQAVTPAVSSAPGAAVTALTTEHLVASAVNHADAVKAGPFVFLNGHEGYDFAAGVIPAVAGAPGFPEDGRPGLRARRISYSNVWSRTSNCTDFAHSVGLDQYYTEANAVGAYHLARFAALGKYVPPSTSIITERCFGGKSTMTASLVAALPDPQWEIKGVYPKDAPFFA